MVASVNNKLEVKTEELDKLSVEIAATKIDASNYKMQLNNLNSEIIQVQKTNSDSISEKEIQIVDLRQQLFTSQTANMFISGSPYPVGFDRVRLGDPIKSITEVYPYQNVSNDDSSFTFEIPSDVFTWLSFNYNNDRKDVVEAISFDVGILRKSRRNPKPELPDDWLLTTLNRTLGNPFTEIGPDKQCLVWRLDHMDKTLVFYKKGDTSYMISNLLSPGGCYFTKEQETKMSINR